VFQRDGTEHRPEQLAFGRGHDDVEARFPFDQLEGRRRMRQLRALTPPRCFDQSGANVRHRDGADVTHERRAALGRVGRVVRNPERT
jgi:hypothetical protein